MRRVPEIKDGLKLSYVNAHRHLGYLVRAGYELEMSVRVLNSQIVGIELLENSSSQDPAIVKFFGPEEL